MSVEGKGSDLLKYTQKDLIEEVSMNLNIYEDSIREVFKEIENCIAGHLMETTKGVDVSVRAFEGFNFQSSVIEEHYHTHPTKGAILVPEKVKVQCSVSTHYQSKRTKEYEQSKRVLRHWKKQCERNREELENRKTLDDIIAEKIKKNKVKHSKEKGYTV